MSSNLYKILIDQTPSKQSQNFLSNSDTILQTFSKSQQINKQYLSFSRLFSLTRILNGPSPDLKVISVFRAIIQQQTGKSVSAYYCFLGIYMYNTTSSKFQNMAQRIQPISSRIRDVGVDPSGQQMIIITQNQVQKYSIQRSFGQKGLTYSIQMIQKVPLPQAMSVVDIGYHPNGTFLTGISYTNISKDSVYVVQLRPFKLNASSLTFQFAEDVSQKCMDPSPTYFQYLKKWSISIDKNHDHMATIAGYMDTLCSWNLLTMKIQLVQVSRPDEYSVIPSYPDTEDTAISGSPLFASINHINSSTPSGYFIGIQPLQNHASRFKENNNTLAYKDVFSYVPDGQTKDSLPSKCIDVLGIGGIACIRKDSMNVYISKLDENRMQVFQQFTIKNVKVSKGNLTGYSSNQENQVVQNTFYDVLNDQLCFFYDLSVKCYSIKADCLNNGTFSDINQCENLCKNQKTNTFWDPISMSCTNCPTQNNCSCKSPLSFNKYSQKCQLNCSMASAVPHSQYHVPTFCACSAPYSWHSSISKCRFNCSFIENSDNSVDFLTLPANQCKCKSGYQFIPKLNPKDTIGQCQKICENGEQSQNGKCLCPSGKYWDQNSKQCLQSKDNGNNEILKSGLAGWAVALIVISILAVLTIIGIFLYRKYKSRKQTESNIELPVNSDTNRQSTITNPKQSQQDLNNIGCSICGQNDSDVNCQGPCSHRYHFGCIKDKIDGGQSFCPYCSKAFSNGLADLKIIQQYEEFSIENQ